MITPEEYRITDEKAEKYKYLGRMQVFATDPGTIGNGAFLLPKRGAKTGAYYFCLATVGEGWEHVSVTIPSGNRCATWEEMCYVKDIFWSPGDYAMQFHPPHSEYVSQHKYCLHLWRPTNQHVELPNKLLVGLPSFQKDY